MQMTRHETTDPVTGLLAELAGVTDPVVAALSDTAAQPQIRMATAGSLLASTHRLTATVIEVLSQMTHRGVIADEGVSVGAWLRTFAARTTGDVDGGVTGQFQFGAESADQFRRALAATTPPPDLPFYPLPEAPPTPDTHTRHPHPANTPGGHGTPPCPPGCRRVDGRA